jgi:hypothetical protein
MIDIIRKMPCWYIIVAVLFSVYYASRGIVEQSKIHNSLTQRERIFVHYIQEILFKVVFTVSGFVALFIANYIFSFIKSLDDIGTGTAILLIFLILWGITGISGYLTYLIVEGKFPPFQK